MNGRRRQSAARSSPDGIAVAPAGTSGRSSLAPEWTTGLRHVRGRVPSVMAVLLRDVIQIPEPGPAP